MPKLSVRLPDSLVSALDQRAHLEDSDRSKVIQAAVRSYLNGGSLMGNQQMLEEAVNDLDHRLARLEQVANLD
jgi:metal-responsive CopG/Arc/MetJ family transcriptional regulator